MADKFNQLDLAPTFTQRFTYSVAVNGGGIGDHAFTGSPLPNNALIVSSATNQTVAFTSGGAATIAATCESAGDLQAAQLYSLITGVGVGAGIGGTGVLAQQFTMALPAAFLTTTATRIPTLNVTDAAVTAGTVTLWLTYMVP